ncbi:MAG: hypothetical protein A2W23_08200 [Planctomycetes bacterium RBG_16_43_13]|nr:MAG: hypothetical protein A2W23_08200 [Planctomycetes bacterium RBG_16_43_13]
MRHEYILSKDKSALLIIDMQDRLMREIVGAKEIAQNVALIIETAKILHLPILLTEHNSRVFGQTIPEIKTKLDNYSPVEKIIFSCFGSEEFRKKISDVGREQLIVVGIETHICVCQTVLDAMVEGYDVHVVSNAVSARSELDHKIGLEKMYSGGAIPSSTEIVVYDLLEKGGTDEFRAVLPLIKKKATTSG